MAAPAKGDSRLVRGKGEGLALVVDQCEFTLDEERTVRAAADSNGHSNSIVIRMERWLTSVEYEHYSSRTYRHEDCLRRGLNGQVAQNQT